MLPSNYGISHIPNEWRVGQYEAVKWCKNLQQASIAIMQAATGSGKSHWPIAMSKDSKSIVLTETKSLQRQYGSQVYNAAVVTGRSNHPCVFDHSLFESATAEDCAFSDSKSGMWGCPASCPYRAQLIAARKSPKVALNYAYWFLARSSWNCNYLFLDEAHRLPEIVLEFVSCTINGYHIKRYSLPPAPAIAMGMPRRVRLNLATDWLNKVLVIVGKELTRLARLYKDMPKKYSKLVKSVERLYDKVSIAFEHISTDEDEDWYIGSNSGGFVAKPLTARHDFSKFFLSQYTTVLQSATIGNPNILAKELGIEQFEYRNVPSRFTPDERRVWILDCPRMGKKRVEDNPDYPDYQADSIKDFINDYDPSWHWLIHAKSKKKIYELADRLADRGFEDRVWVVPEIPTDEQTVAWEARRLHEGTIILSWSWSEGVDLPEVNGVITADVPFAYLGDDYIRARMKAYPQMYRLAAAQETEQRLGRIRRGVSSHYNINGAEPKAVGIADGNYTMLRKYYSEEFVESLEER